MDTKHGPFAASERTTICHINPTPYRENVLLQDMLTPTHFTRQVDEQEPFQAIAQLPGRLWLQPQFALMECYLVLPQKALA
jgi:hypothetical protein